MGKTRGGRRGGGGGEERRRREGKGNWLLGACWEGRKGEGGTCKFFFSIRR